MPLVCPRCRRTLEYTGEPPTFCGYCGNRLPLAPTVDSDREAATAAPRAGAAPGPADVPEQVGGYRLLRPLGAGGMGKVYEAEEAASGRRVALKLIAPDFVASPETVERFRQEGRLASGIAHPRCVFVLAADEDAGRPYIVMELMPGDTLETLVQQQGPLPPEQAVAKILDVVEGLREAHRLGVVHRDIKPSNCFLEADGRVKVGDFGLAKSLVNQAHLTRTGTFLGTVLFCSPEQVRSQLVDQQSDVYSVAATLYYLLAGQAPFQTGDAAATLARIVADPAPSLRTLRPDLPGALDQVVLRGLERDRQRRWRSLDEFRAALLPFAPGRLSIGGVGLRFGAYLLDHLVLLPLPVAQTVLVTRAMAEPNLGLLRASLAVTFLFLFVYYAVPEGLWGCTPGKRWLRLRVWRAGASEPPGLPRALLRTAILMTLTRVPIAVLSVLFDPRELTQNQALYFGTSAAELALMLFGVLLVVSTMRTRNGYRCLHDVLSGTRVVCLPEPERRRSLPMRALDQQPVAGADVPPRLGGFVVRGSVARTAAGRVLLGDDPSLGRQVLLWLRPAREPPLAPARRDLGRVTRLRWLAAGQQADVQWDAFLAPVGCPLAGLVAAEGPLPWPEVRPLLEQLTDELAAADADATLPQSLTVGQVWVQTNGQVLLLDMPLGVAAGAANDGPAPDAEGRVVALLGATAVLALEGRPRPADAPPGPVCAPLPGYAARILQQLLQGPPSTSRDVRRVHADLRATRDRPAEVTRPRRLAHLAVLTAFLGLGLLCMSLGGCMSGLIPSGFEAGHAQALAATHDDLTRGTWREFVVASLGPAPTARVAALAQVDADLRLAEQVEEQRRRTEREHETRRQALSWPMRWYTLQVETQLAQIRAEKERQGSPGTGYVPPYFRSDAHFEVMREGPDGNPMLWGVLVGFVVVWPVLWVLWAFLLRGGLSFRLLGLSLVRGDGRPATRWQCAWRALLVWAPVTALLASSVWLGASWDVQPSTALVPRMILLTWWSGWALLPVYGALAVWHPNRAPHDRLAGTYLVPR